MIYYLHMIKTIFTVKNMIKKQYLQLKNEHVKIVKKYINKCSKMLKMLI